MQQAERLRLKDWFTQTTSESGLVEVHITPAVNHNSDLLNQDGLNLGLHKKLVVAAAAAVTDTSILSIFPADIPIWMVRSIWLTNSPWDLYRGRSIELLVSPKDLDERDDFDTPRFCVSWGCISATTPEELQHQLESEEDIGCLGTLNTEVWGEALDCILCKSAN